MMTSGRELRAVSGLVSALAMVVGCGGTVVFEEDDGGGGSGASGPSTSSNNNVGPGGGDGGAGSTSSTEAGPTTSTEAGPTTSTQVGPSSSSGVVDCGTFDDDIGLFGQCDACMESACCDELLACTQGTACWNCVFEGFDCDIGEAALAAFSSCYQGSCNDACSGGECGPGEFQCDEGGCIPERWVCDGFPDCKSGSDEFCGCGPGDFQCFESGECIPGEWECDGILDCADGTDEQFCQGGICDSGVSVQDPNLDQCLGEFCCFEFNECSDFGNDVEGCFDCLQNGGAQCQSALDCAFSSPCLDQPGGGVCDSGLETGDPNLDQCLGELCCDEFNVCTSFGEDVDACFNCFNQGGGPLCDGAINCGEKSGCFSGGTDICGLGLTTGDPGIDGCLNDNCCPQFEFCAQDGVETCIDCFNNGGGPLCDEAIVCFETCI